MSCSCLLPEARWARFAFTRPTTAPQVLAMYVGRKWRYIEEHLNAVLGAQCAEVHPQASRRTPSLRGSGPTCPSVDRQTTSRAGLGGRLSRAEPRPASLRPARAPQYGDRERALWHFAALLDCAYRTPAQQQANVAQASRRPTPLSGRSCSHPARHPWPPVQEAQDAAAPRASCVRVGPRRLRRSS
jgi:hypothetical protein